MDKKYIIKDLYIARVMKTYSENERYITAKCVFPFIIVEKKDGLYHHIATDKYYSDFNKSGYNLNEKYVSKVKPLYSSFLHIFKKANVNEDYIISKQDICGMEESILENMLKSHNFNISDYTYGG